jgi:hypothetical protein
MMNPSQLDRQSPIQIHEYVEIGSPRWRELDETPDFTKKVIRYGLEDGYIFLDSLGRVWCKWERGDTYTPLHFEVGNRLYGYKMSSKAAN